MKSKILIIGPFPDPVHGMSLSNKIIYDCLSSSGDIEVYKFDITLDRNLKSKSLQGKISFLNIMYSIFNFLKMTVFLLYHGKSICYITPPQSSYGYLRLLPGILLSKALRSSVFIHIHGSRFADNIARSSYAIRTIILWSFKYVDRFIVLGESIKNRYSNIIKDKKIKICENGVPYPEKMDLNQRDDRVKVLFLSNLMKDKGILEFLDAVEMLDATKFDVDVAGTIEPSNRIIIEERMHAVGSKITYHGSVSGYEKAYLFNKADIFVLPSHDEGQPLSILEAYSYSCAVLATDVGGVCDIFSDKINGKSLDVGDSFSIYKAITSISREDIRSFGYANKKYYDRKFTQDQFIDRILTILSE